jgi:hypothetical protein
MHAFAPRRATLNKNWGIQTFERCNCLIFLSGAYDDVNLANGVMLRQGAIAMPKHWRAAHGLVLLWLHTASTAA